VVTITAQGSIRGGAGRIGTRSGLDVGGAAPHNARLPLPDTTTARPQPRVARQPPGALAEHKRERALAGCSGGASGPCRPGLI
jgi:hypothetical protein